MTPATFWNMLTREDEAAVLGCWTRLDAGMRADLAVQRGALSETALHVAVRRGFVMVADRLLASGADVNARDDTQNTPLHVALVAGKPQLADMLLARGASIDVYGPRGLTLLHQAVLANNIDAVKWLLARGADADVRALDMTMHDQNAFHLAADSTPDIMRALLHAGQHGACAGVYEKDASQVDALRAVLLAQRVDILDEMLVFGININARGDDGLTPVQFLLRHRTSNVDSADILRRLHEAGADLLQTVSGGGETLLMLAVRSGWSQAFDYLLDAGVPVDAVRHDGSTLLHIAAHGPRSDVFAKVLQMKGDVNARNRQGQTPLWLAAHHNRRDHVAALLDAGADPTIPDIKQRTPDMVCQSPLQRATQQMVLTAQRKWRDSAKGRGVQHVATRRYPPPPRRRGGFSPSKRR